MAVPLIVAVVFFLTQYVLFYNGAEKVKKTFNFEQIKESSFRFQENKGEIIKLRTSKPRPLEQYKQLISLKKNIVCRIGQNHYDPSVELKMVMFKKTVLDHLKVCFKVAFNKASRTLKDLLGNYGHKASFYLEINKDGSLKQLLLSISTGVIVLDDFLLETIQQMAPFPPIPNHLGLDSFVITHFSNFI